jgi:hypothetical protein
MRFSPSSVSSDRAPHMLQTLVSLPPFANLTPMTTAQQRICAVSNYSLEYFQQWHRATDAAFRIVAAQMLVAAGRGPARFPTCEQTLRHIPFAAAKLQQDLAPSALLLRALALLCAGELQTLRVTDPATLAFILSALVLRERREHITCDTAEALQRFAPLRVVEWTANATFPEAAFALLGRYAANITELDCPLQRRRDAADNVLARCNRLESLTCACHYAPSAWLQLSQLHTLRGVNLSLVSTAAIAAALPRLHTLGVVALRPCIPAAAVAGFFEDLLPRLQVFQYVGWWPQNLLSQDAELTCAPPPLPHLWNLTLRGFSDHPPPWTLFMGARPLDLCTDAVMIQRWLPAEDDDGDVAAAGGAVFFPLASVRTLEIASFSPTAFSPTSVARLLRAAPHLETLTVCAAGDHVHSSWVADATLGDFVHWKLRHLRLYGLRHSATPPLSSDTLVQLRLRHFPRLKGVAVDGCDYFVTPLESTVDDESPLHRFVQFAVRLTSQLWGHRR